MIPRYNGPSEPKHKPLPPITDINTSRRVRDPCPCCRNHGMPGPTVTNPITGDPIAQAVFRNEVLAMCARCVQAAFLGGTHPHPMQRNEGDTP